MTFGEYLKGLRQSKGISQKELSSLTQGQVSNAEISRLEAGIRKKPSPAVLKILAPHLGVPVEVLLTEAGYMDSLPAGLSADANARAAAGIEPDSRQTAQPPLSDGQRAALKAENLELKEHTITLALRTQELEVANKELNKKYNALAAQGPPAAPGDSGPGEVQTLKDKIEQLKDENQRIKEETIAFLEEGDALRAETDNYRKRVTLAEDTARKATRRQEELEAELNALKKEFSELGSQAGPDNALELQEELRKAKESALALTAENNALSEKSQGLAEKNNELAKAAQESTEKNAELTVAVTRYTEKSERLEIEAEELRLEVDRMGEQVKEALASESDLAEKERKIEELKTLVDEAWAKNEQLLDEKEAQEKEMLAFQETMKINAPMLEKINNIKVSGIDLGNIFTETVEIAGADDLDTLARLMLAMSRDSIKQSDQRMLMDILKRFIK